MCPARGAAPEGSEDFGGGPAGEDRFLSDSSGGQDLLHSLVRDADKLRDVPHAVPGGDLLAGAARRYVRVELAGLPQDDVDAVELMISELASNCVSHARSPFEVAIERTPAAVSVEVTNYGHGTPVLQPADPLATSGRGLQPLKRLERDLPRRRWQDAVAAAPPVADLAVATPHFLAGSGV
jgi:hypothetical protein